MKTLGISPKAIAALLTPVIGGLGTAIVAYSTTGHLDAAGTSALLTGVGSGIVAFGAAFLASPGPVQHDLELVAGEIKHFDPQAASEAKAVADTELPKVEAALKIPAADIPTGWPAPPAPVAVPVAQPAPITPS